LDVNGAGRFGATSSVSLYFNSNLRHTNASGSALYLDVCAGGAAGDLIIRNSSSFTTQLTLSSGGNLGLGVTSAFANGFKSFQVNGAAFYANGFQNLNIATNVNGGVDGAGNGGLYSGTGAAARYQQTIGEHRWYTAPSGTAGNAISFTQAMTLDASGNLLLGTTSATPANANGVIAFGGADAGIIYLQRQTGTDQLRFYTGGNRLGYVNTASSILTLGTANFPLVFATNDTERARITSGGVLDIGTGSGAVGQIQFPATQVASSNANTLDDYEEGTWTPVYTPASGAFGTIGAVTSGRYVKIGKVVYIWCEIRTTGTPNLGTASGQLYITGLPFTVDSSGGYGQLSVFQSWNLTTAITNLGVVFEASKTRLYFTENSSNSGVSYVQATEMSTATSNFGNLANIFGMYTV
jgi:hypothetical protein